MEVGHLKSLVIALVALMTVVGECMGTLNSYENEPLENNFLIYRRNAMYSLDTAPFLKKEARASIEIKLDFKFPQDVPEDAVVQVSAFPLEAYRFIGVGEGDDKRFCCTPELAAEGKVCDRAGRLIIQEEAKNYKLETYDVFPDIDGLTRLNKEYQIHEKGWYYLVISYCNPYPSAIEISGVTRWVNPFGFLPGEVYGFLPFYMYMSVAYLVCAMAWAYLCSRQWRDLLPVQNWCTAVIGFGLLEVYLRYMDFHSFNSSGERSKTIMLSSIFFLCVKKTLSRMLVLVVSIGYGVVKPTLGDAAGKIMVVGSAYFAFSVIQLTVENLSHSHSLSVSGYLLVLPVICFDFLFFLWIFSALSSVIESLSERRQDTKLKLYVAFRRVLVVCVSVGVLWSIVFSYCIMTSWSETHWESLYKLEAFWDVLYFGVLVMILYLWAPTSNSNRYAYDRVATSEQEGYDDDLEDVVAVKGKF